MPKKPRTGKHDRESDAIQPEPDEGKGLNQTGNLSGAARPEKKPVARIPPDNHSPCTGERMENMDHERYDAIVRLWDAGNKIGEIAKTLRCTRNSVAAVIRVRHEGFSTTAETARSLAEAEATVQGDDEDAGTVEADAAGERGDPGTVDEADVEGDGEHLVAACEGGTDEGAVEEEPVLPYSEREVARVLRFVPGAVTKARKRAGIGPEDAAYMPDARLSRGGVEKLLAELGIAVRTPRKKQGVDLDSLCEASEVKPGPVKHSIEVITCTVNRRLCTGVHCASGALVRLKVADNSLYLPGMEILARHVEGDLYEALETPRARGRI